MRLQVRPVRAVVDRFAGLSDRAVPVQLSRIESPDLLNVDLSGRTLKRRLGYSRINSVPFGNASARFDGVNDSVKIPHLTVYAPGTNAFYIGFAAVLWNRGTSATTIICKGFGVGANQFTRIKFDPTVNANAGGWTLEIWDAQAAALRTLTVNDGDGLTSPQTLFRFLEVYFVTGTPWTVKFSVKEATAAQVGALASANMSNTLGFSTNTEPFVVGVSESAAGTIGTDYASFSIAELRYFANAGSNPTGIIASASNGYARKEWPPGLAITDPSTGVTTNLIPTGYWQFNDDDMSGQIKDLSSNANNGQVFQNPPAWSNDAAKVLGQSGLRFNAGVGWIKLTDTAGVFAGVFQATAPNVPRWDLRFIFCPELPGGATTVPDQDLIWFGTNATNPQPLSVTITSDNFVAKYDDGGTIRTLTLATSVTSLVGKRVRVAVYRHFGAGGNGDLVLAIAYDPAATFPYLPTTASVSYTGLASATAGTVGTQLSIGRRATASSLPYTFAGLGPAYGTFDDLQLVHINSTAFSLGLPFFDAFSEKDSWAQLSSFCLVKLYLKLNEGAGRVLSVLPSGSGFTAYVMPEEGDGLRWDLPLVTAWRPPRVTLAFDYRRFLDDGTVKRSLVAICGAGLYDVDRATGAVTPLAANILKGGLGTISQYGQRLFFALPNGLRPQVWNGATLDFVGIRAPVDPPTATLKGAGGSFVGKYWLYVTFRSTVTFAESNPSPGVQLNFTGGNDTIDSMELPTSSDPQVNQRRIWITSSGGADGSVAYLLTTVDDNVTTTFGTDQSAPATSGTTLEYFNNQEAPQGSIVRIHKDYLFVSGNQVYPTRVFRSAFQSPTSFGPTLFVDLDQDTGNIVTALDRTGDFVLASLRKGAARVFATGDANNPLGFDFLPVDHGSVGPQSFCRTDDQFFYFAERDLFTFDGASEANISSPLDYRLQTQQLRFGTAPNLPSIQTTVRDGLNTALRRLINATPRRGRNQIWFAYPSSAVTTRTGDAGTIARNDAVLVFDKSQRVWSKYDLPLETMCEANDSTDDLLLIGGIEGYLCKLDSGTADGLATAYKSTVSGAWVATATALPLNTSLAGQNVKGLRITVVHVSTQAVSSSVIADYSNLGVVLYPEQPLSFTPVVGDLVYIGAIPWYADFIVDHGDPFLVKRPSFTRILGVSDNAANYLRYSTKVEQPDRGFSPAGMNENLIAFSTTARVVQTLAGKNFATLRVRISETDYASAAGSAPVPCTTGSIEVFGFDVAAEGLPMQNVVV